MSGRFADRRVLVTGASRGIGAAIAERFAAEGAAVAIVARTLDHHDHLAGSLRETCDRMTRHGARVFTIVADLTDETDRARIVPEAIAGLGGPIEILVNNAAAAMYAPLEAFPLRRRRLTFEANVHAPLDLAQGVIPAMRAAGQGWIVNLSSGSTRLAAGPPFAVGPQGSTIAVYGASKAALNRITNGLGVELYGTGIRVNTVEPRAAVLSEGAAELVGATLRPDQIESMEEMVEAVIALCDCPAEAGSWSASILSPSGASLSTDSTGRRSLDGSSARRAAADRRFRDRRVVGCRSVANHGRGSWHRSLRRDRRSAGVAATRARRRRA